MKRILLSIIIIAIIALGWLSFFKNTVSTNINYNKNLDKADKYYSRELYDLAIDHYEKALKYKDSNECRKKILKSYYKRSKDTETYGLNADTEYVDAMRDYLKTNKTDVDVAIKLSDALVDDEQIEEAYDALIDCQNYVSGNKELTNKIKKLKYTYALEDTKINEFRPFYGEKAVVKSGVNWGVLNSDSTMFKGFEYSFINQVNKSGYSLIKRTNGIVLYDDNDKVVGKFGNDIEDATMYSYNRIAIKSNGKFDLYSKTGKKINGGYDAISTFKNNKAVALKKNKWFLVDEQGNVDQDLPFQKVIFDNGGYYDNSGIVIAMEQGKYYLYNSDFEKQSSTGFDEIDVPTTDKLYAFRKDSKWGFVNNKGEIKIQPQFEGAKSFSNGIAAVKKNGKWGFINKKNKEIIKCEYLDADYFTEAGSCLVKCNEPYEESGTIWKLLKFELGLPEEK